MNNIISKQFLNFFINKKENSFKVSNKLISHLINTNNEYLIDTVFNIENNILTVINIEKYKEWIYAQKKYYSIKDNIKNRTDAAHLGLNTHTTNSQFSIVLKLTNDIYKPTVLVCNDTQLLTNYEQKKYLLIIENLDVFFNIEKIKNKLRIVLQECDIIYGSGNSINNNKNKYIFKKYNKIFSFLDIDYGGFKIYLTLKKFGIENNIEVINVYPNNLEEYFKISKFDHNIENIFSFVNSNNDILNDMDKYVLQLIKKYEVGMEQEIFLKTIRKNNE